MYALARCDIRDCSKMHRVVVVPKVRVPVEASTPSLADASTGPRKPAASGLGGRV